MVVLVRTRSRATYLFAESASGVHWCRIPRAGSPQWVASGIERSMPRIVPGERLLLNDLRTTPVTEIAVLASSDASLSCAIATVARSTASGSDAPRA